MFWRRAFTPRCLPTCSRALLSTHPSRGGLVCHSRYLANARTRESGSKPLCLAEALHRDVEQFHSELLAHGRPHPAFLPIETSSPDALEDTLVMTEPTRDLLEDAMLHLSQSTFPEDCSVLQRVIRTTAHLLRMDLSEYVAAASSRIIGIGKGEANAMVNWLWSIGKMSELDARIMLPLWHRLLETIAQRRNDHLISVCFKKMALQDIQPTTETSRIVVTSLLHSSHASLPPYDMMKHVINLFASAGIDCDQGIARVMVDAYTDVGQEQRGKELELLYLTTLATGHDNMTEASMHEVLASLSSQDDQDVLLRQYQRFRKMGLQPTEDTLLSVIGDNPRPATLKHWRNILRIHGGVRATTKVMERLVYDGFPSPRRVLEFYRSECRGGVIPSPAMLHYAIHAILASGLGKPSESTIDGAVELYQEFLSQHGGSVETDDRADSSTRNEVLNFPVNHPTARTYQLLLRSLTSSQDVAKRLPVAVSIVEDMQRFGVQLDPQSAASLVVLLMRSSTTPTQAMQIYRSFCRPPSKGGKPVLDEEGYNAILHTYCNLDIWPDGLPSTRKYFEIVSDMRKHGLQPNAKAYTIILRQLASRATAAAPDSPTRQLVAKSIKRVHNNLTVNTTFTPDVPLWNQLMDAYQRAGCFAEALSVWQKLFASRQFTNTSVSIVLDTCAFAKAYDVAVRIYTSLAEIGYPLNLKNWKTFLECLCRMDKLDEAMKVLCLEMSGRDDGVAPDVESVRILLKFATGTNQETEVLSKVKRFLPKLYHALPDDLR